MLSPAENYWNKVYKESPFKSSREADPFLQKMVHRLQKGKVLDIGMGEGQNSVYLAKKGYQLKGFDISSTALKHAQQLASEHSVEIHTDRIDLDLYVMALMEYDTVLMLNFKPPISRYYSEIIRTLKMGGTLLIKSFMDTEMVEALGPEDGYKNYYYHSNELLKQIKDLRILFYNEDIIEGKKVVQCLAQKPTDKDAEKYNLFDMQSNAPTATKFKQHELAEALFKKK